MPAPIVLSTLTPETKRVPNPPEGQPVIATKAELRDGTRVDPNTPAPTGLLFSPDFNAIPDWQIQHTNQRYSSEGYTGDDGGGFIAGDNVPAGFDFYYTSERWHPNGDATGANAVAGSQPIGQINNLVDASNKALIIYDESYGNSSEWGADMVLTKQFANEYQEMFAEVQVRYQSDWAWESALIGNGQSLTKVLRIGNFRGPATASRYGFTSGVTTSPLCFLYLGEWVTDSGATTRGIVKGAVRPLPYSSGPETTAFLTDSQPSSVSVFGDGQWHTVAMHLAMNSAAGVADGVMSLWVDGSRRTHLTNIEWNTLADSNGIGFNIVHIGGNSYNTPYPEAQQHEQWWALKGLKVYDGLPQEYL